MAEQVDAKTLKPWLTDGAEIAFLDIREHGQYGEGHPFFAVPMPYSRLESAAAMLLPCKTTRICLLDDGDAVAEQAADRLRASGYTNLSILAGGAPAWAAAGYTLFKGVNVPSKTFGELLEHELDTPRLGAEELHSLRSRDESVVVLDGRSPAEFRKMSLPGAQSCPNAELAYRLRMLVPDPSTTVVINCAGRTRSILGVEGLRLTDIENPLFALENGTQGWKLAGLALEHGQEPASLPSPDAGLLEMLAGRAQQLIRRHGLPLTSAEKLDDLLADPTRTTYLLDVRSAEEYAASHWPGARHAPGGQLVQATDQYVAVRNSRIVLSDDIGLRAATTAIWLKEMGHDVCLLDADARQGAAHRTSPRGPSHDEAVRAFSAAANGIGTILDASHSMAYRDAHIEGARWVTRPRLGTLDSVTSPILVTGRDQPLIDGVATDLQALGYSVRTCAGTPDVWRDAGHAVVSTPTEPPDEACIDYLFFVHDRHDGNLEAARRYLAWETGLLGQLDEQERSVLRPGSSRAGHRTGLHA
ncbi:MAG: rhodanese-like domain-containing protein [Pseudomonadota bacterium]